MTMKVATPAMTEPLHEELRDTKDILKSKKDQFFYTYYNDYTLINRECRPASTTLHSRTLVALYSKE